MPDTNDENIFSDFKRHFEHAGGAAPSESEDMFMARIAPRVHNMARRALTKEVRRAFDSNDITSTVLRRVVGCVRRGTLRLETEGQFMSLLTTMTQRAIIDKHDYLNSLLRQQSRNRSTEQQASESDRERPAGWDLTEADDVRRRQAETVPANPVDEVLLAEKLQALNRLCRVIQEDCHLQPDEWHMFKLRFLEELTWKDIARDMGILDDQGRPSADAARMRVNRIIDELRPKLKEYEEWLQQRPNG